MEQPQHRVAAVVPVKPLALAKSRVALPAEQRRALALAFALDTVSAVASSPLVAEIVVVTTDPTVSSRLREHSVRVVPDEGAGLSRAVHGGLRVAASEWPDAGLAVVPADLPCLRPDDVTWVVAAALAAGGGFVPDRSRNGTTLLVHAAARSAVARYGPDSATRHRALGLRPLTDAPRRARHDVDTLEDLREAALLGLGPETARAIEAQGIVSRRWQTIP